MIMRIRLTKLGCAGLVAFLAFVFLLIPTAAHADDSGIVGNAILIWIMDAIISLLDIAQKVVLWALSLISSALQSALEIDPSGGGAIIYTAWRTLRDMCNMAFIIALIMMAFGTIFDSLDTGFLKAYSINGRGVIVNFLIAAILLNFSLAIGQTVVAGSNKVSSIVVTLLPKNIGPQIAQSLGISRVANQGAAGYDTLSQNIPPETLTPSQYLEAQTWTPEKLALLQSCLKGELGTGGGASSGNLKPGVRLDTPMGCYEAVRNGSAAGAGFFSNIPPAITGAGYVAANLISGGALEAAGQAYGAYKYATQEPTKKLAVITGHIFSIAMLSTLLVSFITMIIFLLIRLPAIWILLALSPIAWTALAFPGTDAYQKWWKEFWAWNLFSPLYLFVLYMSVLLLQNTNVAIASLGAKNSAFISSIGVAFQYLIAGIVINGGTALVLKASFLSGTIAGKWVGKVTGFTGVGGNAFAPAGRFAAATGRGAAYLGGVAADKTGATGVYRGVVGGVSSEYEKRFVRPTKEFNELSEAKTRATLFGDSAALEKLQRGRIQEATKKNEEKGLSVKDMKQQYEGLVQNGKTGTPEYFALGQALIKEGALSPAQMKDFGTSAGVLGRIGQNAIQQQIARKIAEQTKEKKYKDDKNYNPFGPNPPGVKSGADKAKEYFDSLPDEKDREKFLENLKKTQLAVYAQMASDPTVQGFMASKGIDMGANGQVMRGDEIIENNSSKLEAGDIPAAMKLAAANGWQLGGPGSSFAYRRDALLGDKKNISAMLDAAEPNEQAAINQRLQELKKEARKDKKREARINAEALVKAQKKLGGGGTPPAGGTPTPAGPGGGGGGTPSAGGAGSGGTPTPTPVRPAAPRGGGGGGTPAAPAAAPVVPPPGPRPAPPAASAAPGTPAAPAGPTPRVRPASPRQVPTPPPAPPTGGTGAVRPTIRGGNIPAKPKAPAGTAGSTEPSGPKVQSLLVQIDGKPVGVMDVPEGASEGDKVRIALQDPGVVAAIQGRKVARTFQVGRFFNIVTT